jgi:hypothetical protein
MMPATCDECGRPWEQLDGAFPLVDDDEGSEAWLCSDCWDRIAAEEGL